MIEFKNNNLISKIFKLKNFLFMILIEYNSLKKNLR